MPSWNCCVQHISIYAGAPRPYTKSIMSAQSWELYPSIEPFQTGQLGVAGGHVIYWEQSGNPAGQPVVFLHGGPGTGICSGYQRFFDPAHYRIVAFDQRGAGRSTPFASTENNTTQHLVSDMERLREHLGIGRWLVFGGSWGVSLALAYGISHADRCAGFILRGVFLSRKREVEWLLYGVRLVFPDVYRDFVGFLPKEQREDVLESYYSRLTDPDLAVQEAAAIKWDRFETSCSSLTPQKADAASGDDIRRALSLARLEAHYFRNDLFMPEDYLLANIGRVQGLPAVIVQGRYDMVCPIVSADELAGKWPGSEYVIVPNAGHSDMEPGIESALVGATERFKAIN